MNLPAQPFYLFGMGDRRKLLYRAGRLFDALTGETVREWEAAAERLLPSECAVQLTTPGGAAVLLSEDERGVWVEEDGRRTGLAASPLHLPRFERHAHSKVLRTLHHELLVSVVGGRPVPNLFVYPKPWYRDAAMMALCLERTGNLHLVREWVLSLREPFDENNGCREPDNLGQALFLISLVSDRTHPLMAAILQAVPEFRRGNHLVGPTDGAEHPVYQTKWLKFGLRRLGLDDAYEVPPVFDSYSALFWMDYREAHVPGPPFAEEARDLYPYLAWAEAHFHGWPPPMPVAEDQYPLTWEAHASQARYTGMSLVAPGYVERRLCAPHSWHAAEMFLYLLNVQNAASPSP